MLYLDYNEKQMHGTKEFPIAFYHVDHNHPRYEMPFHWHKEYEIVKIIEGSFRLMLADSEIIAAPGESLFIPSGVLHGGVPQNCIYECLVFDLDILFLHTDVCRQYFKKIKRQDVTVHPLITGAAPSLCAVIDNIFLPWKNYPAMNCPLSVHCSKCSGLFSAKNIIPKAPLAANPLSGIWSSSNLSLNISKSTIPQELPSNSSPRFPACLQNTSVGISRLSPIKPLWTT